MYGIFTYIYPTNGPNVGKYTIHGAYGIIHGHSWLFMVLDLHVIAIPKRYVFLMAIP
jgi:hypothetical protein